MNYTTKGFLLPEGSEFFTKDHANFNAQKSNDLIVDLENTRPKKTTDNIYYYVDGVNGSNTNDGLTQATAFKNIYWAISRLPQVINNDVTIYIYPGTYDEILSLAGFTGSGKITLQGMNGPVLTQFLAIKNCTVEVKIASITFNGTGNITEYILINNCTSVSISNTILNGANLTAPSVVGILCYKAQVGLLNCTISNMTNAAIFAHMNSFVSSQSNLGNGNAVGLKASDGIIFKLGTQPGGTTAQEIFNAGQIFSKDIETQINSLAEDASRTITVGVGKNFTTIQSAINSIKKHLKNSAIIDIAIDAGTYSEVVTISGFYGSGAIRINNGRTIVDVNIKNLIIENTSAFIIVNALNATATDAHAFHTSNIVSALFIYIKSTSVTSIYSGFIAFQSASVQVSNSTFSNHYNGISAESNSKIYSENNSGSGNNNGLTASKNAAIGKFGTQPSGTTAELTNAGGVIR